MSTNAYIYIKRDENSYEGIYCHYDGYISGVGATLYKFYDDVGKINQLINLGDISSLDKECSNIPKYETFSDFGRGIRIPGYTFAYHRDAKEPKRKSSYLTLEEIKKSNTYSYIWNNNTQSWFFVYGEKISTLKEELLAHEAEYNTGVLVKNKTFITIFDDIIDYRKTIKDGFIIVKDSDYKIKDFIKFIYDNKENNQHYELTLQIIDQKIHDGIKENFSLFILSSPPKDVSWWTPCVI